MENNNLIKLSFNYYDFKKKEYKKYYNPIYKKYYDSTTNITYLNKNNNNILKIEEQFLGTFNKDTNIFTWGWYYYVDNAENKHIENTYIIKKILNYILKMKIKNKEMIFNIRNIFLRYQYNISYPLELELILAMTLYITKSDMIYREDKKEKIIYYLLRNVEIL
jgi:hypothetical protein